MVAAVNIYLLNNDRLFQYKNLKEENTLYFTL